MSNTVRNGFSTLNRLLGKKNKNPLSKSATNLNKLSTTLDSTSQHNQIVPLAASTNAPFEQTFRITVCLPLDQLYVVRVGAKTKLSTLLEMVCTNKLLDKEKFIFTHPVNVNQIFDLSLTIGEVGLNEIRLAHKTARHPDEHNGGGVKYRHTTSTPLNHHQDNNRYATRPQSMFITKSSPSPYSSTNSLNSTDSSGINLSLRSNGSHPPVAPTRKKRVAPRPPSQNSIPEDGEHKKLPLNKLAAEDDSVFKRPLDRKDFHVSSPNLSNGGGHLAGGLKYKDFHVSNGNIYTINEPSGDNSLSGSDITNSSDGGIGKSTVLNRPLSIHCDMRFSQNEQYDAADLNGNRFSSFLGDGNHSRTSSEASETATRDSGFPEPTPRKRVILSKKKAPAPPPRTTPVSLPLPVATPRSTTPKIESNPRIIQTPSVDNDLPKKSAAPSPTKSKSTSNVTKVMLNMENLQINIPDDTVVNRPAPPQSDADHTQPENSQNVFQQKITHNEPTQIAAPNAQSKQINQIGSKLTDDEKTKAIEFNVNKKNSKNLTVSRGVRFNGTEQEIVQSSPDIDHEELNKEINDILEKATEEFAEQVKVEMGKEITNIINRAVEINETTNGHDKERAMTNGNYTPTDHTVNENDLEQGPESPQWLYSLPAPTHFADGNMLIASDSSSDENYGGKKINSTVHFTSSPYQNGEHNEKFTEIPIQPIIKKKQQVDFHEYSDNSLGTSNTTGTMASTSTDQDSLITSDIEDGYQGNDTKTKRSRELIMQQQDADLRREQFIESEFEFLSEHDDKSLKHEEQPQRNSLSNDSNAIQKVAPLQNGDSKKIESNRLYETSNPSKTDVIDELTTIINTNRLDSVIKKNEESDDIDAAKRCSLSNFQIRSYTKSVSEHHNKPNGVEENVPANIVDSKKRLSLVDDRTTEKHESFAKPREFTPIKRTSLTLTNGHGNNVFKSPRHINRSDSFHSTHSMQQSYLQPHFNGGYAETLSLTPRSSSYISLIGTQRYENRTSKQLFGNELNENTRRKSSSELSIADSPSLQSLSVMKSILSNSRKNSLNNLSIETPIKVVDDINKAVERRSSHEERKLLRDERDFGVEQLLSVEEPPKNQNHADDKVSDNAMDNTENEILTSTPVSKMKAAFESKAAIEGPKKWKYQGPPAISLSTWSERPKSQVVIKSDNDYKFGGIINNKKSLLQNRFSTAAILDKPVEPTKPKPALHKLYSTPQPLSSIEKGDKPQEMAPKPAIKPVAAPEAIDQSPDVVDAQEPTIKEYERRITPLPASECQEQLHRPIVRGVEYKKNINLDENFIKNDPIMRTKSNDDERVVMRSRSNYEVSRIVNERPFSLVQNGPAPLMFDQANTTMTLGRVQIPNKFTTHRQTINFAPQPYVNGSHTIQRNSSFTAISNASSKFVPVVKGFRTQDVIDNSTIGQEQQKQTTVKQTTAANTSTSPPIVKIGAYESQQYARLVPLEKPAFAQFTLRKTGLKERILDANDTDERTPSSSSNMNTKTTVVSSGPKSLPPAPILPKPMPLATNRTASVEAKRTSFTPDPRNQLLDSIRNFSKNGLRKA